MFFAWTKATFDGQSVDFWNQAKQLADIEFREVVDVKREAMQVSFSVRHAFTVGNGNEQVDALDEIWTVTIHQTPKDYFMFDIESVQKCATTEPLVLEKYHYGGMAFRGNTQWLRERNDHSIRPGELRYLTSEGKGRSDGNHTRPDWVAFTGKLDGQEVSTAIFCSPQNFRAHQHVRIHPSKPYFCFAPMVDGSFQITPGKQYRSNYRYLVMSKAADEETIQRHWKHYVAESK